MKLDNRWVKADGSLNELPITIHSRENWQATADSGNLPICIQIAWNGTTRNDSNAFPTEDEMQKIELFHHQLQLHLESSGHAVIAMVITHDGINQWVIYTDDIEQLKEDLNKMVAPEEGYPIEIVADEDPEWKTFKKVFQAIQ
jgi:hypothetical protein